MLHKSPQHRLCGLKNIQQHPWFADLDWKAVLNKTLRPTFEGKGWAKLVEELFSDELERFDSTCQETKPVLEPLPPGDHIEGFDFICKDWKAQMHQ